MSKGTFSDSEAHSDNYYIYQNVQIVMPEDLLRSI